MVVSAKNLLRNKKGYLRLIEMSFAAALILGFLIFVQQFQTTHFSEPPSFDPIILKAKGQDVLRTLDLRDSDLNYKSDLRERLCCDATTWDLVASDIAAHLPANIGFSLYSVDSAGSSAYKGGISEGSTPSKSEIVAVTYIVAGEYGNYSNNNKPCSIKLLLWFNG